MPRKSALSALLSFAILLLPLYSQAKQYSVVELKEQAAQGWRQTYTAHGRTIVVAIPVEVPQVAAFPIIRVSSAHPTDRAAVQQTGSGPGQVKDGVRLNNTQRSFIYDKQEAGLLSASQPKNLRVFTQTWQAPALDADTAYALNNPATLKDAQVFLMTVTGAYFPDLKPDFTTGTLSAGVDARVVDLEKGMVLGKTWDGFTGGLNVRFYQVLSGIPILSTVEMAYKEPSPGGDNPRFQPLLGARVSLRNIAPGDVRRHLERAVLSLVKEGATLTADAPLCSLEKAKKSYEALIAQGRLRRVDSLRLGYVGWYDKKAPEALTLLPCWVLEGLLYPDAKATGILEDTPDNQQDDETTFILVNAQTGQLIDPWRTDKNRSYDAPKIINWK